MARNAPPYSYPGPFVGLRRDVHPASIGPAYCEDVNNVVFRKGRIERRLGFAHIAGDSERTCPWITALEHLIYESPDPIAAINYVFGILSGFEFSAGGNGKVFRVEGVDGTGVLGVTLLDNPNAIPVPWSRAHFARFDDWVLVAGIVDRVADTISGTPTEPTRMPCFRLNGTTLRELGLAAPTAGPAIGRNWAGAFVAADQKLRVGSAPQYRVHYYDAVNNIESDSGTTPEFTEVRTDVTDAIAAWPGVGFNIAFSTTIDRSGDFAQKFDQALVIKLTSKSDPENIYMIGNVLSDDGVNVVMTSMIESGSPTGDAGDLEISIASYPAATGQRVFVKNPPSGHPADSVRIYRRELGEQEFALVEQVLIADLADLGNGWSYYSDTTLAEDRDFDFLSPLYNQQPFAAEAVFNHQDIPIFLGVAGKPRNRVYFGNERNVEEAQTGAHYMRETNYVSLPLDPNELQELAGASYRGECIVFTHDSAYAISGVFVIDEDTGAANVSIRKLDGIHGALHQNLVLVHDGILYHYDAGGLWAYDGASDSKVTAAIEDYRPDAGFATGRYLTEKKVNFDYWHLHRHRDSRNDWLVLLAAEAEAGDQLGIDRNSESRGTTATTIALENGAKALTISLTGGRLKTGDRIVVTNGTNRAVIAECLDFDSDTGACNMVIKGFSGSGSLSGTSEVFVIPPMPNRAYVFNLDSPQPPDYGGGWTVFKHRLTAVCSVINAQFDSVLVMAGSSSDLGGPTPEASSLFGYGRTGFGERLGAVLTDPFANFAYRAVFGSPVIGDMRHPLRFFDITFQFDDDVNVPDAADEADQWSAGDLLVGFIHGNRRFSEGPPPLGSAPLIGCEAPDSPHFTLRLRCANYRGAPILTNDQDLIFEEED